MRKLSKLIVTAVALIAVSFTGCSNLVDDATIDSGFVTTGAKAVVLTATSDSDIVKFSNGAGRMIMPGQINATSGYEFWLYGTNETTGQAISLADHTIPFEAIGTDTTKGSVTLTLDIARYKLNLYVCKTGDHTAITNEDKAKQYALLWGQARADFTYGDAVNFYLTPYGLQTGGDYKLTVYLDGWELDTGWSSKVSIKTLKDGAAVANAPDYTTKLTSTNPPDPDPNVTNSGGKVAPGTYNFIVDFYSGDVHYYYSDRIVILSNQETIKSIPVPNVIGVKPTAPEALGISYVDPVTPSQDYYEIAFEWKDKSYNEEYFQLELVDLTDVTANIESQLATLRSAAGGTGGDDATTVSTAWTTLTDNESADAYQNKEIVYTFGKQVTKKEYTGTPVVIGDFDGNTSEARYVDGSFRMNNDYAVIRVDLGHRYIARLAAYNAAGTSDYIYADIVGTTVAATKGYTRASTGEAIDSADLKKFGTDAALINRFRITYNLDGGHFYEADEPENGKLPKRKASATPTTAVDGIILPIGDTVIRYGTQASTIAKNLPIMNALYTVSTDDPAKKIILYDSNSRNWSDWRYMSTTGEIYETNYNVKPASDAKYSMTELPYMQWDETTHKKSTTVVGFSNISLYATYKSAGWEVDHSADFNIQDSWVKMYYGLPSGDPATISPDTETPATSKVNGTWTYVYGTRAPASATAGQTTAAHIFPLLLNDATNNTVNGVGVSYNSVWVEVIQANGNISKRIVNASSTQKDISTLSYTMIDIDLSTLAADTYELVIHAYAETTQKEYTYPIAINVGQ